MREQSSGGGIMSKKIRASLLAMSLALCSCGGGGGNEDSQAFLGGVYDGTLSKVTDTCNQVISSVQGPWTVNQNGTEVELQEQGANGHYAGRTTSDFSFEVSGSDN